MKTVVALYQRFEDAQQAVQALIEAGFDPNNVNMIASDEQGKFSKYMQGDETHKQNLGDGTATGAGLGAALGGLGGLLVGLGVLAIPGIGPVLAAGPIVTTLAGAGVGAVTGGIVGALVDLGIPEENAKAYAEGIRQGGTLVAAQTEDQRAGEAQSIMNRFNPIDLHQQGSSRTSYSTGYMPEQGQVNMEQEQDITREDVVPVTGGDRTQDMSGTSIPVVEEDLDVSKRQVDRGGVRVESTVEETPVEEDVNLRQEHVTVERRPVDRPATDEDMNAFKEGAFEVHETGEEPVVEKRARVVEEVDINKDVNEETRTIRDTVRRTDVNVQPLSRDIEQGFMNDYQTRYSSGGSDYTYYQPAYRFGYDLANDPRYRGYDWNRMEPIARQQWQSQGNQSAWEDVKDAVKHAWNSVANKM